MDFAYAISFSNSQKMIRWHKRHGQKGQQRLRKERGEREKKDKRGGEGWVREGSDVEDERKTPARRQRLRHQRWEGDVIGDTLGGL